MAAPPLAIAPAAYSTTLAVGGRMLDQLPHRKEAPPRPPADGEVRTLRLRDFVAEGWPVLEAARKFVPNWHIDCIAEHLEAVSAGSLKRLLINVPFRASKSMVVSVMWNAWDWIEHPWRRWLFNSYHQALSLRDALKTRRLIESAWYQQHWGMVYQLTDDQNRKERYDNTMTGFRVSTSVDGANTGEGGDIRVADDPHNTKKAESDPVRENVLTWWDETMPSRVTDFETAADVIVMQRVHQNDLSGHLLAEQRGYHHLCLPGRYEPAVYVQGTDLRDATKPQPHDDCTIYPDPRTTPGETIDPVRFSDATLEQLAKDLKQYGFAGQVQQRPIPREGAHFSDEMFRPLPALFDYPDANTGLTMRETLLKVCAFDLKYSEATMSDHAAGVVVGIDRAFNIYVLAVWRSLTAFKALPEEAAMWLRALAPPTRPNLIVVEEAAFKKASTQNFVRLLRDFLRVMGTPIPIDTVKADLDKVSRAALVSDTGKVGQLHADRNAPWWLEYITEFTNFPKSDEDDQVDATAHAQRKAMEVLAEQPGVGHQSDPYRVGHAADVDEQDDWLSEVFDGRTRIPGGGLRPG